MQFDGLGHIDIQHGQNRPQKRGATIPAVIVPRFMSLAPRSNVGPINFG
jgi:hypothetical protein